MAKDLSKTKGAEDLYSELLAVEDCYRAETAWYVAFLRETGHGLVDGLPAYAKRLEAGYTDRSGKPRMYSTAAYNKRIAAAKNRIRYAFKRSPQFVSQESRLQLDAVLDEVKLRKKATNAVDPEAVPSKDDLQQLVKAEAIAITTRLFIAFMAQTGVRVSEMLNIMQTDITKNGTCYRVRIHGKGNKQRDIKVTFSLLDKIQAVFAGETWLFEHAGHRYNRNSVTNAIRLAGLKILGHNGLHSHSLRHFYVTDRSAAGIPLPAISEYVGHSSVAVTADIYSHVTMRSEEAMVDVGVPGAAELKQRVGSLEQEVASAKRKRGAEVLDKDDEDAIREAIAKGLQAAGKKE